MNPKQTREMLILGALVLLLVGAVVWQLQSMKPHPVAQPSTTPTTSIPANLPGDTTTTTAASGVQEDLTTWVPADKQQVATLVADVSKDGARDPFTDMLFKKPVIDAGPNPVPNPDPTSPGNPILPKPTAETYSKTLNYISTAKLSAEFKKAKLENVSLIIGKKDKITIKGMEPDFTDAKFLISQLDVPAPVPPFVLTGVITTQTKRYAAITLDGKYYTLLQGESIPPTGWTVTTITPTSVTLSLGKQTKKLQLSGGSSS